MELGWAGFFPLLLLPKQRRCFWRTDGHSCACGTAHHPPVLETICTHQRATIIAHLQVHTHMCVLPTNSPAPPAQPRTTRCCTQHAQQARAVWQGRCRQPLLGDRRNQHQPHGACCLPSNQNSRLNQRAKRKLHGARCLPQQPDQQVDLACEVYSLRSLQLRRVRTHGRDQHAQGARQQGARCLRPQPTIPAG